MGGILLNSAQCTIFLTSSKILDQQRGLCVNIFGQQDTGIIFNFYMHTSSRLTSSITLPDSNSQYCLLTIIGLMPADTFFLFKL